MESLEQVKVTELLPQQPPFVMIDRLIQIDDTCIATGLEVKADNIFVEDGVLTEAGIIENIAQTGAARMGYIDKYINKGYVKLGFIGEIKNLTIETCPCVGEIMTTTIEVTNEVLSTLLVRAEVKVQDTIVAACTMKIFMTDIAG